MQSSGGVAGGFSGVLQVVTVVLGGRNELLLLKARGAALIGMRASPVIRNSLQTQHCSIAV